MAIQFPVPDSVGQIYTEGEKSWRWGGLTWDRISANDPVYSTTPPLTAVNGQMWINKNTGRAYFYLDNNWLQVSTSDH